MRCKYLLLVVGLVCLPLARAAADALYHWVDEQGRSHYSDQPVDGAELIEVAGPQRQSDHDDDAARKEANKAWFEAQQKRREKDAAAAKKADAKRKAAAKKQANRCETTARRLADKEAELAAKKRAGISVAKESQLKIRIDLLQGKLERECG